MLIHTFGGKIPDEVEFDSLKPSGFLTSGESLCPRLPSFERLINCEELSPWFERSNKMGKQLFSSCLPCQSLAELIFFNQVR